MGDDARDARLKDGEAAQGADVPRPPILSATPPLLSRKGMTLMQTNPIHMTERALDLSGVHAQTAGQAARVMTECIAAMTESSAAFAKSAAERNIAMAATLMSAKSAQSPADLHRTFVQDSLHAARVMATRIADACAEAAKRCAALAAQSMETATTSGPVYENANPRDPPRN
jgi:hypothetical protein